MKEFRPFYFIVFLVLIVSLACGGSSTPTAAPIQPQQQQELPTAVPVQPQEQPTQEQQQSSDAGPFFTEEFDSDPQWYYEVIQDSDKSNPDNIKITFDDSLMIFDIPDQFLYAYYIYEGYEYDDVKLTIKLENRGVNSQQVSLVCRNSGDGWYEWAVQSDGLWYLYAISGGYNLITNGGSNDIKQGKDINEYSMICKDNQISFFINGKEQKGSPYTDRTYGFRKGSVGFAISSLRATPVKIEVDFFEISEP